MSEQSGKSTSKQIPIMEGFFTWPSDKPQLIGGRCKSCGTYFFPKSSVIHKPDCKDRQVEEVLLSRKGRLDSFTVQRFAPPPPFKSPTPFIPYAIGWVALPEGVAIAGILTGRKIEDFEMNMDVELVVEKAWVEEDGNEAMTWKWRAV